MRCYKCNCELSPTRNRCSKCGTDVRLYRRLCKSSNVYYNTGLDKAKVRDLTGAVNALKMSVSLDKTNIDARNLLGLVYFEMGETALALREWVISNNMLDYDNDAAYFLQTVQGNPNKLDIITESIKKYNFSLKYAREDGEDLAIIQLKKVIQANPNLLRAYQLLALLYIHQKQYRKAESVLKKCLKIDRGNTTARRYMQEIRNSVGKKESAKVSASKLALPKKSETKSEEDDFDTDQVIIPVYTKSFSSYFMTALDILIGVALGVLILYFVVMPGVKTKYAASFQDQLTSYQTSVSADKVTIAELNETITSLEDEKKELEAQIASADETAESGEDDSEDTAMTSSLQKQYDAVLNLLLAYVDEDSDIDVVANAQVLDIDDSSPEALQNAYEVIKDVYTDTANEYYVSGYDAYEEAEQLNADAAENDTSAEDALDQYDEAVGYFESCIALNPNYGEAYLWLGVCQHHLGKTAKAKYYYEYFLENYSDLNESLTNVAKVQLESIED